MNNNDKTHRYKMRFTQEKLHRIIIKKMSNATLFVVVAQVVRPPPIGVKRRKSNRLNPYWIKESGRGFLVVKIVLIKHMCKGKEKDNGNT